MTKIVGIDPGNARIGYAIIAVEGSSVRCEKAGTWEFPPGENATRLAAIEKTATSFFKRSRADRVGIERLFFSTNRRTAMAVAEARGVLVLAAAKAGLSLVELAPNEVKQAVTGDGRASKQAVAKMIRWIVGLPQKSILDDTTDAIAIAIAASRRVL